MWYRRYVAACLPCECTDWPTEIITETCERQRLSFWECGTERTMWSQQKAWQHCWRWEFVTWWIDNNSADFDTSGCYPKSCWFVTEFCHLFRVLCKLLTFSFCPALYMCKKTSLPKVSLALQQGGQRLYQRVPEWLRLAWSSGSIRSNPHSSRDIQSRGPRPTSRQLLKVSKETLQPPGNLCQCSVTHTAQKCSWFSEGASCVPVCAHCLMSWH